jgi:cobalt-zinc-cadmium efflux system outer membrane protein
MANIFWTLLRRQYLTDEVDAPSMRSRVYFLAATLALLAQPLHLADAFARARDASPDLRAARETVRAAQSAVDTAGALNHPTLATTWGPDEPALTAQVDVRLPIFQRGSAIAAAERDVQTAQADAQAKSVMVRAAVRRAYAALAGAQERAKLARDAFALAADLEQRALARVRTGMAPQLEAVQAGLARRRAAQERDDRAAMLAGTRQELGRLLMEPDASSLEAADPLYPLPDPPPLDALLQRAAQHPEIEAFRHQQDAALARAHRERAALLPLPDLSLMFEQLHGTSPLFGLQGNPAIGLRVGIAFDLPLLNWNSGKVHEAQAQSRAAAWMAAGALAKRTADLRTARAKWDAAASRAKAYASEIVPLATDLVRMAREAWELGRTPLTPALLAQGELTSARAEASDSALLAQQAMADMEEASGEAL